ncbi:hypothetical protein [Microlunatus sp. Y2014]|uniref:hypothetical protein n=1 Tax=Microlunatus sp. Y2014 TaxID=3418488 RepID=UPI003DA75DA5
MVATLRCALSSVIALLVTVTAVGWWAPPAEAAPVVVSDSTADRSRTFRDRERGNVFSVQFQTTKPNEDRRVHGVIVATLGQIDDDIMLAMVTLKCWGPGQTEPTKDDYNQYENVFSQQRNVLRGESSRMSLRWTYRAVTPGTHHCVVNFYTMRPRPVDGVDPADQKILVDNGSLVSVTSPLPTGTNQVRIPQGGTEFLTADRPAKNFMNRVWQAPAGVDQIAVNGDFMVTSCTYYLADGCEEKDQYRAGGTVKAVLYVKQYNTAGTGYCNVTTDTPDGGANQFISRDRHHQTLRTGVLVPVSTAPDCSRNFRIYVALTWVSGAAIKVHSYSAVSAAIW